MNIKLKQILICIPMILIGGLLKSQYSGIVFTGDTMILELDDTLGGNIQWQEREDTLTIWKDIAGGTTNPYQFIVPSANDKIKYYRAKIVYTPSFCKSYSTEINFKIVDGNFNLKIGDYLAGGIYFYHNNEFALIAAPRDQNHTHWGCEGVEINGADSSGIGSGEENTRHIIDQCNEPGIAAHQADTLTLNGFTDWYLPSINELQLMIESLYDRGYGFIAQNYYWSSTESHKNRAWGYSTLSKQILEINKNDKFRKLHPIRKLSLNQKNKLKYSFKLLPNDEIHDLKIVLVKGSLTNVLAIHTGEGKETDNYIWDFGNGNVVSGSGKGPYEINYNYGGYSKITAKNSSSDCPNEVTQSNYFRVKLFEKLNLELPPIYMGALDWGDYNNDGLLDILSTGSSYFEIYKNVGNDSFTKIPHLFPKISLSGCDWGDFNNDQLLDFAVCGYSDSNCITEVYENVGNDSFIKLNSNLPGVKNGFVKWFDMDNDGSLELLISGEKNDSTPLTKIFTKFGSGQAVELNSKLVELKNSAGSFGDYNKDGYTDLLISGHDGAIRKTIIYKNDFGNLIETPIEINGIENGSVDWGDYDNDGALDFAITGAQDSISIEYLDGGRSVRVSTSKAVFTGIYRQDKIDSFKYNIGFDKLNSYVMSSLDWGDYDNDGYIDLAISGVPSLQYVSVIVGGGTIGNVTFPSLPKILRNNQNHTFNNIYIDIPNFLHSNTKIENVEHDFECRSISFGDYNNDGNLDLLREGKTRFRSTIYKNETYTKNNAPSIPENLISRQECAKAQLNWNNAFDDHTPTQSITYEIYVGSSPGQSDILSKANTYTIRNTYFVINKLKPGTYYWSVKAVDQAQSASAYAPEQSFTISPKPATPVISFNGSSLLSNTTDGNQWYNQNGPVAGATQQTFVPLANGTYYVIVFANGCSSDTSNKIQVILSDVENDAATDLINVYPNPVDDVLTLESNGGPLKIPFEIANSKGQTIHEGILISRIQIPTNTFAGGLYFIKFQTGNLQIVKKLIKE